MQPFEQLEHDFGEWSGFEPGQMVACASGTAALHLALEALDLPFGEVLVPEFTMIACARAVTMAGLQPVFVDCGDDLNLNLELFHSSISLQTVAAMPVHVYGRRCNMEEVTRLARKYRFVVIEDLAEAHGVVPHADSAAAAWSFYRNKIIAGEEGGMIAFRKREHANKARELRSLGFSSSHDFLHVPRGINARMSNVHAELILQSLKDAKENLERRALIEHWYDERIPSRCRMPKRDVCWVYDVRIENADTGRIVDRLNSSGISARLGFKPMSMQPEYKRNYKNLKAYRASWQIIYLPVNPSMSKEDVGQVCSNLLRVVYLQQHPHLKSTASI